MLAKELQHVIGLLGIELLLVDHVDLALTQLYQQLAIDSIKLGLQFYDPGLDHLQQVFVLLPSAARGQ